MSLHSLRMNIATALNQKYMNYTIVMLTSLCENNPVHIDAYILHSELTKEDFQYMQECLAPYDIVLESIFIQRDFFHERFPRSEQWSIEMYYRLFLLDYLPPAVERILYLDVDLIVNRPLGEFYSVDFDTDEIIACIDCCKETGWEKCSSRQRQMFTPMIEMGYRYFNSGVMLMNVGRMRGKYNIDSYMQAIQEWDYDLSAPDQDILNYVHWQKVGYVDPYEYNLFARIAHNRNMPYETVKEKACIIYFAGDKPWNTTNIHYDIEKIWWEYAAMTPCYQTLVSEFMEDVFLNQALERKIQEIFEQLRQAEAKLKQMEEVNEKLVSILQHCNNA